MKTHSKSQVIETNITESQDFSIKSSPEAYEILSDKLYSDKISAVIRELSTNAYDAHVVVGKKDTPFEVHLPEESDMSFSVKDFGPGMTHEEVVDLYTTYFGTNKTHTNDQVGALGLGSKSPFAYVSTFSVTVIQENKKRIYTCFKKDKTPSISLMAEMEVDEDSGVEVKVPVNPSDVQEFKNKAVEIYKYFDTLPNANISIDKEKHLIDRKNWSLRNNRLPRANVTAVAIQGNVAYPLNYDIIFATKVSPKAAFILNSAFNLKFKIGEVDVNPSRESLSYDQKTIDVIINRAEKTYDEYVSYIEKDLDAIDSMWEVFKRMNMHRKQITTYKNSISDLKIKYKGEDFPFKESIRYKIEGSPVISYEKNYSAARKHEHKEGNTLSFHASENIEFVVNDLARGALSRVKNLVEKNSLSKAYIVDSEDHHLMKFLQVETYHKASQLEKPYRYSPASPAAGRNTKKFAYEYNGGSINKSHSFGYDDINAKNDFYILARGGHLIDEKGVKEGSLANVSRYIKAATRLNILNNEFRIFAITPTMSKRKEFIDFGMREFTSFAKKKIENKIRRHKSEIEEYTKREALNREYGSFYTHRNELFCEEIEKKILNTKLSKDLAKIKYRKKIEEKLEIEYMIRAIREMHLDVKVSTVHNHNVEKEMFEKHPYLKITRLAICGSSHMSLERKEEEAEIFARVVKSFEGHDV